MHGARWCFSTFGSHRSNCIQQRNRRMQRNASAICLKTANASTSPYDSNQNKWFCIVILLLPIDITCTHNKIYNCLQNQSIEHKIEKFHECLLISSFFTYFLIQWSSSRLYYYKFIFRLILHYFFKYSALLHICSIRDA